MAIIGNVEKRSFKGKLLYILIHVALILAVHGVSLSHASASEKLWIHGFHFWPHISATTGGCSKAS